MAAYPVARSERYQDIVAGAGQTVFGPLNFDLIEAADLAIQHETAPGVFEAVDSEKSLSGAPGFATVTFAAGRTAGELMRFKSARLDARLSDVTLGGAIRSAALEAELVRFTKIMQEVRRDVDLDNEGNIAALANEKSLREAADAAEAILRADADQAEAVARDAADLVEAAARGAADAALGLQIQEGDAETLEAAKAYVDQIASGASLFNPRGTIDVSADPDYPAGDKLDLWFIEGSGKIGGASGEDVDNGDFIFCLVDGSPAGNQAVVGGNWSIVHLSLLGAALLGAANVFTAAQKISVAAGGDLQRISSVDSQASRAAERLSGAPAANHVLSDDYVDGNDSALAKITYTRRRTIITDPTAGAASGRIVWQTRQAGAVADRLRLGLGLYSPNATSGDKGLDTLNVKEAYEDGARLIRPATKFTFGTRAYSRSLEQRFGELENLMDWKTSDAPSDWAASWEAALGAAQSSGKKLVIPGDAGEIHFATQPYLPDGCDMEIVGERGHLITTANAIRAIQSDTVSGEFIHRLKLRGLIFDGGAALDTLIGVQVEVDPQNRAGSWFAMDHCEMRRFSSQPLIVKNAERGRATWNDFFWTKDPAFVACESVWFAHNRTRFGTDNGVSIGRGTIRAAIHDNIFEEVSTGIYFGGFNAAGAGTATLSGGVTWGAGEAVTLTVSNNQLRAYMVGGRVTLRSGTDEIEVELTAVSSGTVATGQLAFACPASLRGVATSDWIIAYHGGNSGFDIHDNLIVGASIAGIALREGCRNGRVAGNVIRRPGFKADRDKATTGRILAGSTSLVTADVLDIANNDYIIIKPWNAQTEDFMAQVTAGAGTTTLTLGTAAPAFYLNAPVFALVTQFSAPGIYVDSQATGIDKTAQNIVLADNQVHDFGKYALEIAEFDESAATARGAAGIVVDGLLGTFANAPAWSTARALVHIQESNSGVGKQTPIFLDRLRLVDANTTLNAIVRIDQRGATPRTYVRLGSLWASDAAIQPVRAFDLDNASADISSLFHYQRFSETNRIEFDQLDMRTAQALTDPTTIAVNRMSIAVTLTADTTVTDFTREAGASAPLVIIRNTSDTYTLTLQHDLTKIRCPYLLDYDVPPTGAVLVMMIGDIAQVVGTGLFFP